MPGESSAERLLVATARATAILQRESAFDATRAILRDLGEATGVDRAYLVGCPPPRSENGDPLARKEFEWLAPGAAPSMGDARGATRAPGFERWLERMRSNGAICGPASEFPADEQGMLRDLEIRSLLAVPVPGDRGLHGFLGFDACRSERTWTEPERIALSGVALALGAALDRQAAQHEALAARRDVEEEARVSSAIASFARETSCELRHPSLADSVCRRVAELLRCDAAFAVIWCEDEQAVRFAGSHGLTPAAHEVLSLVRASRAQIETVFGSLFAADDVAVAEGPAKEFEGLGLNADVTWRLRLALRRESELVGAIAAFRRGRKEGFRDSDLRLARGLAQVASLAFESVRLLAGLDRASRLESRFVATMSHELRTPLNVVIGYLEMLGDGTHGALSEEQRHLVERAGRSALSLASIVEGGLDLGRIDAGRQPVTQAEISLAPMLGEAVEIFQERFERKGLAVRVEVGPEAAVLHSDRAKLDAIARNLVGNAVKFTERGRIEIGTRRDGEWVEISVRDTGVGIPRESLREIFEPFRRLGDGPPTGGVGLGLHIVARLVEMLGGRIEVESEVGRGSTFRVFLRDPVPPAWT